MAEPIRPVDRLGARPPITPVVPVHRRRRREQEDPPGERRKPRQDAAPGGPADDEHLDVRA